MPVVAAEFLEFQNLFSHSSSSGVFDYSSTLGPKMTAEIVRQALHKSAEITTRHTVNAPALGHRKILFSAHGTAIPISVPDSSKRDTTTLAKTAAQELE
jgi:hypothetical protein